jgi:hypothetical protein
MRGISSFEHLLVTASLLERNGVGYFSAEQLIVLAWASRPKAFEMKAYPQHPDTRRGYFYFCGKKGLVGRGYLGRVDGRYSLTEKGRRAAMRLVGEPIPTRREGGDPLVHLPEAHDILLRQLFVRRRRIPTKEWTFADACLWWRLLGNEYHIWDVQLVARQLAEIILLLAGRRCVLSDGQETTAEDVAALAELDTALRQKFSAHLKVLANRNGAKRGD